MFDRIVGFIQGLFRDQKLIVLHEPKFEGNERKYVLDTIDSTFVSSVGAYVPKFEAQLAEVLGVEAPHVIAVVNGTNALQIALKLAGVEQNDMVVTQALTFIATCNAIKYLNAEPAFVDVEESTMGMSPEALEKFLNTQCKMVSGHCVHTGSGKRVKACVPMHTFGHPVRIDKIAEVCKRFNVALVEDAAESLGSTYQGKACGTFGDFAVFSFNGNKIVTTGGGGAIYVKDLETAKRAKHLTTTAKVPHKWAFVHDEVGYNFRMPNLNAALGCAQLEKLDEFLEKKRTLALKYSGFFEGMKGARFVSEPKDSKSNYWLNTILLDSASERDAFLSFAHEKGVHCRPVWEPMHRLKMFKECVRDDLKVSEELAARIVNLPSTAIELNP